MAADITDTRVVMTDRPSGGPASEADAAAAVAGLPRSERYLVTGPIAAGGMGEVLAAQDIPLAREVVIKRMRTAKPSAESITRFLREARIQGRLQHPSIVPVHDLAVDDTGRPFFVMKALGEGSQRGETLASILSQLQTSAPPRFSRAQLLRSFVDVCQAIALAHDKKVLHRDLKPSNIALGSYGEVYVLDWGVARILDDDHPDTLDGLVRPPSDIDIPRVSVDTSNDDWPLSGESAPTMPGAILGTPGYMSPEQQRGDPDLGPTSDIYALGCILFEILAREPLHPRSGPLASTAVGDVERRPSRRVPGLDLSPELDEICVRATQQEPEDRFQTAAELANAVQRYLDGDRDVARRREIAAQHVREAKLAAARGGDDGRREAVRLAGGALALDPESADAAQLLGHLITTVPKHMPAELRGDLDARLVAEGRAHARLGTIGIATYYLFLPMLLWVGVADWTWLIATYSLVTVATAVSVQTFWMKDPPLWRAWMTVIANAVIVALFARLIGPFVLSPGMACVSIGVTSLNPRVLKHGYLVLMLFLLAALAPWGLELVGVLAPSYQVTDHGFLLFSAALRINNLPGQLAIAGYVIAVLAVMALLTFRASRSSADARARLEIQAWHLRQIAPSERASRSSIPPALR